MFILRGHYATELTSINKEIASLWAKGNTLMHDVLFDTKDKLLTLHMEKFNKVDYQKKF